MNIKDFKWTREPDDYTLTDDKIEKWGTGIPRLFEACEEYGLPKPELIDFDGDFRVNMYRMIRLPLLLL